MSLQPLVQVSRCCVALHVQHGMLDCLEEPSCSCNCQPVALLAALQRNRMGGVRRGALHAGQGAGGGVGGDDHLHAQVGLLVRGSSRM